MSVNQGDILAGKFRVEKLLGSGGMGMVVAAHHLQLDELVAIKFLLPEALKSPEAVGRFAREARAATKIKNEHVVRIIDIGHFDSGEPYIVMEYLNGEDLSQILRARGPLPPEEIADYLLQACEAIAEAHALGIVHRDLKPANLFVAKRMDGTPLVKVLDFGISKITTGPDMALTKTSAIMGSPLYMSPEQMASARNVDSRTDLWALGAIFYEMLTGVPPFDADTITELCVRVLQQPHEPVRVKRPDMPPEVDEVVSRCLMKSPDERYANIGELAVALAKIAPKHSRESVKRISGVMRAAGHGMAATALPPSSDEAPPPVAAAATGPKGTTSTAVSWSNTGGEAPKRSVLPLILTAAAIGLVGIGGLAFAVKSFAFSEPALATSEEEIPSAAAASLDPPATEAPEPPPPPSSAAPEPSAAASITPPPLAQPPKPVSVKTPAVAKPAAKKPPAPKVDKPPPPTEKPPTKPAATDDLGGRM